MGAPKPYQVGSRAEGWALERNGIWNAGVLRRELAVATLLER